MQTLESTLVLGRYRLLRRIGAGGFGVVWLARDERLDRAVAVKRIVLGDAASALRATREAKVAARLSHPGIVALYEAGRDAEAVYLVSELVEGRSLAELEREGLLSDRDVLRAGVALCDALAHAHRRGVVHRDVKPANVLVPDEPAPGPGIVKLTDFGIAQTLGDDALTATGDVVGTLAYMAPEQAEGRAVDWRADLYALGLLVYEGLAGVNPVRGRGAGATARRVGARLPPLGRLRRDLPADLCEAVDVAVRARPEERGTLAGLRAALAGAVPDADEATGTISGSALESLPFAGTQPLRGRGASLRGRAAAGLAAAALAAAAVVLLPAGGNVPPASPAAVALAVGVAVALLPGVGWALGAGAVVGWLAIEQPGMAVVVAAAALPALVLLHRAPVLRSAPAAAPLLGLAAVAGAWPALAGQAPRALHRGALALVGGWWLVLAEIATGRRLLNGSPPSAQPADAWRDSAPAALADAIWPALTSRGVLVAAAWALAAVFLPLLVRGRTLSLDVVAATAWAAATATAVQAAGGDQPPRGLVAGAVLAAGAAVLAAALRPRSAPPDAA